MNDKRVAIVTGGSRGIGAAIVKRLAADGLHVIAVARNADKLNQIVAEIVAKGQSAEVMVCDIGKSADFTQLIEQATEKHGRLDVLVNNAGITRDDLILRMTDEAFDEVISTNLKSAFVAIRSAARPMMRIKGGVGGRIINISSVSGVTGNAGQANYAASKAGLIGLSKSVAKELAKKNITCNVIAPGFIATDMTEVLPGQLKDNVKQVIPLQRFGNPEEIAGVASFLASADSSYVTGQVICVDGGLAM